MDYKVTALSVEHLITILRQSGIRIDVDSRMSYFSTGSVSYCLLANDEPVFAGGIVNLHWHRGEAWILPTPFFLSHVKKCYSVIKSILPVVVEEGHFRRVQATCITTVSAILFEHLGFCCEGTMRCFGPNGENCLMYSRVF